MRTHEPAFCVHKFKLMHVASQTRKKGKLERNSIVSMQPAAPQAAIMRQGLLEMRKLSEGIYPSVRDDTFFGSCGVADLIASCYGG